MNIISDYQLNYFNNSVKRNNNLPLQTNPNFGNKQKIITKGLKPVVENIATVGAGTVLALQTGKALQGNVESKKVQTNYGPVECSPAKGEGTKSKLEVSHSNGMTMDIFEGIPQEILESPVSEHLHQFKSSTINPNVGIVLIQNPCDYENMTEGVELKMAVPPTDVISSEGEVLEAGNLYMVNSMGHFYNGQPIKRIKSGEVTWNTDMNDMEQKTIRSLIDESLKYEADAKDAKKAGAIDLAGILTIKAKQLTQLAEDAMKDWVLSAQNKDGVDFFATEL